MKTIWKFPIALTDRQTVLMPKGRRFLHADYQGPVICLWYEVDDTVMQEDVLIQIVGTGHEAPDGVPLATVMTASTLFVWHIYEVWS